jgi:hypothetical protein
MAFLLGMGGAQALGVAALKEQPFHRDSAARAVVYSRILDSRGPHLRLVGSRRNVEVLRSQLVARIELPDAMPDTLLDEHDIAPFRELLVQLGDFTARYSRSAPLLEPYCASLRNHISRFDSGHVRFEGNWIARSEFESIRDEHKRGQQAKHRLEVELLAAGASQGDPDAETRSPESPTGLSEAVAPLWHGDREGARLAVRNLAGLAALQSGAAKVRTERLLSAVRNLFTAEARVTQRIIASAAENRAAAGYERNATEWLKPNVFGSVRLEEARDSSRKAAEIRQNSANEIAACKQELLEQLREVETVSGDFLKLGEQRVATILKTAANAVGGRHFTASEFGGAL